MLKKAIKLMLASSALALGATATAETGAEGYPDRPVKIMVSSGTASSPDSIARMIADGLTKKWGQPVVIENAPGLGGIIGTDRAARQEPDGYTLLLSAIGAMSVGVSIMDNFPYDPVKDFEPITNTMSMPNLLVVHPSVPVKTVAELVDYIKKNPGKLRQGHPGLGTTGHLSGAMLQDMTGVKMEGIPYKTSAQMTTDLLAGHFEVLFHNSSVMIPHAESGRATALAITSPKRAASLPDLPTVSESLPELEGFEIHAWWGLYAPAGTPKAIIDKVNKDVAAILKQPEVTKWIEERAGTVGGGSPEELRAYQASETKKWGDLIERQGLKPKK